jgi:sugar-specific transcriptional regulator TrmB
MLYTEQLIQSGLTNEQAVIYEVLIKQGQLPASKISLKTGIKRGMVYKTLDLLAEMKLIEKIENKDKVTLFRPNHPSALYDLIDSNLQKINQTKSAIESVLGNMSSDYNLLSGKPNVRFFEGMKGVEEVLNDSLNSKSEIVSYADIEAIQKYIPDLNIKYVEKREKKQIKKRGLVLDTPFNRQTLKNYHTNVTETRLLSIQGEPFATIMQIYDDKISYITLGETIISVIITDKSISSMHKKLFEFIWQNASIL